MWWIFQKLEGPTCKIPTFFLGQVPRSSWTMLYTTSLFSKLIILDRSLDGMFQGKCRNSWKCTHAALWEVTKVHPPWVYFWELMIYWFTTSHYLLFSHVILSPAWQRAPDSADCLHCYYNKEWDGVRNVSVTASNVASFPGCVGTRLCHFCPDDDWGIQPKLQQVIFWAQVNW